MILRNKSPLEKYGKKNTSPSMINAFIYDPVKCLKNYFEGVKDKTNINFIRGQILEDAIQKTLEGKIEKGHLEKFVQNEMATKTAFTDITEEDKEKELTYLLGDKKNKGAIANGLECLEDLQISNVRFQTTHYETLKKTRSLIKGKTDFECYSEKLKADIVIDTKATKQIKQIEIDNRVQGGIYHKFTGKRIFFLKCSKIRYELQELTKEDIYIGLETAVHVINIMENICEKFDTLEEYYQVVYPSKKFDRSDIMEKEIKKQYRKIFNTQNEYDKTIQV
jgi:hypothetical protein